MKLVEIGDRQFTASATLQQKQQAAEANRWLARHVQAVEHRRLRWWWWVAVAVAVPGVVQAVAALVAAVWR